MSSTATGAGEALAAPIPETRARIDARRALRRYGLPLAFAAALCVVGIALSGFSSGFPRTWVLGAGVPNWFDRQRFGRRIIRLRLKTFTRRRRFGVHRNPPRLHPN